MNEDRIVLFHWLREEGERRLAVLAEAGLRPELRVEAGISGLRELRAVPPKAFLIDLTRLPAQGRAVGVWIRQQKALRRVPLLFISGASEKVECTRELLPDAAYCEWSDVLDVLLRRMESPVRKPVVPGTMSGYAGTPLVRKLVIKPGSLLMLLGAPEGFDCTLGTLPDGVRVRRRAQGRADKILLFVRSAGELDRRFRAAERALAAGGGLWLLWPKKSSGVASDLSQDQIRQYGLEHGLVDYKICAVDDVWSGLLFARRAAKS